MCSPQTHRDMVARVAKATGARSVVIRYRLAPEHPFPAAIDDCLAAYRALLAEGLRSEDLLLGGDSAGGGLCLATLVRLRDAGEPLPAAAILFSPWVDLEGRGATIETNGAYDYVRGDLLQSFATQYLHGVEASDPLASPLRADLSGLPPLLVQTGGAEALRWENEQLVALARGAGVTVEHDLRPGFVHVTQGFARFLPEARQAIHHVGDFVRQTVRQARD